MNQTIQALFSKTRERKLRRHDDGGKINYLGISIFI